MEIRYNDSEDFWWDETWSWCEICEMDTFVSEDTPYGTCMCS